MVSHHHEGFWLDVSTLRNFYDVNLQLASREAPLSVEEIHKGIVSRGTLYCFRTLPSQQSAHMYPSPRLQMQVLMCATCNS